ncbi:hypothetical protein NSMS1_56870 [Nostoc sp. MS1]|nr:hypothetical protein NSMS1_56870 [Nostoc sp. MS1]
MSIFQKISRCEHTDWLVRCFYFITDTPILHGVGSEGDEGDEGDEGEKLMTIDCGLMTND